MPSKVAKDALKLAIAPLPTSLQPLLHHFGQKIITAHCKRYAKESILQRMEQDTKNIPHSAKATEFNITLSAGAKENDERVSFLKQQVRQAKEAYEATLKTVVEQCISLEIAEAKKDEAEIVTDLLPTIGSAIQTLQGIECDKHLQSMNVLAFIPNLLDHCPLQDIKSFLQFYQVHHSLDAIPSRMLIIMDESYPSDEL